MSETLTEAQAERADNIRKTEKKIAASERSVKAYQYFVIRLLIILLVMWALFFKIVGITHMPNEDMYPRLDAGDLVLFYRLDKNVNDQDVVVIEKKTEDSKENDLYILRVVATEGDTVEVTEDRLIVNGHAVIESNIFYDTFYYEGFTEYPIKLKEGECFVMADKRNGGEDSRYFGVVKKNETLGTVITIVRRAKL